MRRATQAGMVSALDHYVGEVVSTLKAKGIDDNTLIFFTSDNGPHEEGGADPVEIRAAGPFRGGKRDLYDGGIRVPLIANWPAKIQGGQVEDTPIAFADILPTLAELVEASPKAMKGLDPNGVSVLPILLNPDAELAERVLYWEFTRQLGDPNSGVIGQVTQAARRGNWKVVRLKADAPIELYDIEKDPSETTNLSEQYPDVANEFRQMFDKLLTD